jgi:Cdc6-like AAA superfamily ATPase
MTNNNTSLLKTSEKSKYLDARINIFAIDELVYEKKESVEIIRNELESTDPTNNINIFGLQGSGKSTLVTREINKLSGDNIVIYINCRDHDNAKELYELINFNFKQLEPGFFDDLSNLFLQRKVKHMKGYELMKYFIQNIKKPVYIILDEIENIIQKKDRASQNFNYRMVRGIASTTPEEVSASTANTDYNYTVVFMTNKMDLKKELEEDVKGSTNPVVVLPTYDAPDIFEILRKRADFCLKEGVVDDEVLLTISRITKQEHDSDARQAIILLAQSIRIAQQKHANKLVIEDVYIALEKMKKEELDKELGVLDQQKRIFLLSIILVIEDQFGIPEFLFHDVCIKYDAYCAQYGITDTVGWKQLSNYLTGFITCDLVKIKDPNAKNKTYIFKQDVNEIKSRIAPHLPGTKIQKSEN